MIDLYTVATSNGQRASILLEELALPYAVHKLNLPAGDHLKPDFLAINPNGMAPVIVDRDAPGGKPVTVFECAAIGLYLAEKTGKLMPKDLAGRADVYKWLSVVVSNLGPAFTGQFLTKFSAKEKVPSVIDIFEGRAARFLKVLDQRLGEAKYLAGNEISIADLIAYPSATTSVQRLPDSVNGLKNLQRWVAELGARPAVQKGMAVSS